MEKNNLTVQHYPGWEEFKKTPLSEKISFFDKDGELFDLIFAQQLNRKRLTELFTLADQIRSLAKTKEGLDQLQTLLSDKRAILFFAQPSTRTFLSFQNACHLLGMKTSEIRDSTTSSEVKGESPEDTIRTFSSYVDLIIMRHKEEGYAEKAAWVLRKTPKPIPVLNGGSGKDEHPTQALLDLYTIERCFKNRGGIENKTIAMVGDLNRGRTVRSLSQLLHHFKNVNVIYVAPEGFKMKEDVLNFLVKNQVPYKETDLMEEALTKSDVIYMTRLQDEYDQKGESQRLDYSKFHLKKSHLSLLKKDAIILHPLPRRFEIEVTVDEDPRAVYWEQEVNGMWIRSALILKILRRNHLLANIGL